MNTQVGSTNPFGLIPDASKFCYHLARPVRIGRPDGNKMGGLYIDFPGPPKRNGQTFIFAKNNAGKHGIQAISPHVLAG